MDEALLMERRTIYESTVLPYLDEIYASSMQMTRNVQMAEDLSAKTFEQSWKYFDQYKEGTNLRAWLYKIMTNTFINDYRKRKRNLETVSLDEHENPDDFYIFNKLKPATGAPGSDPSNVLSQFAKQDIDRAIERLPEEFRVAIVLCDIQGFSYEDIAQMTDVPVGTVRSRLSRGRQLLQKHLWDYSEEANKGEVK